MTDTVALTLREYADIQARLSLLDALEAAGVDNWEGYSYARELMSEDED
jgi:hypothetical protein